MRADVLKIAGRAWRALLRRLRIPLTWLFTARTQRIYRLSIDPNHRAQPAQNGWTCRSLALQDVEAIAEIERTTGWAPNELWGRIAAGDVCIAALYQGRVIGFNLITFGEVCIPEVRLRRFFRPEEAWVELTRVRPEFRRKGVGMSILEVLSDLLRQRSVTRLYAGSARSNEGAYRLARRVGFREVADIHYLHFFGLKTWRCTRVPRRSRRPEFQEMRPRLLTQP